MISLLHLNILRLIYERLKDKSINWVITGSVGFVLQGLDLNVRDVDLQTDQSGAYEIERLFSEYVVRPVQLSSSKRIQSHFGVLELDGIQVEIMGDIQKQRDDNTWEAPVDLTRYKEWIEMEGMILPVLSLEYEYRAYLKLGRVEKAEMLRKQLLVKWGREQNLNLE